jgi:hypothetical protein
VITFTDLLTTDDIMLERDDSIHGLITSDDIRLIRDGNIY